ncbi:polycomb protein Sfmbt-like, partial [Tropilaelaps mercedesae]
MDPVDTNGLLDSEGEALDERSNSSSQFATNPDEPTLLCERCGRQGTAATFYGKKKQYCSFSCSRPSVVAKKIQQKKNVRLPGSFDWRTMLDKVEFEAGPVSSFKFAPLSEWWARNVTVGMKVEVQNHDAPDVIQRVVYWVATIHDVKGYFVKLRYVGFDDESLDFWANLCYVQEEDTHLVDHSVHHVGWCAVHERPLVPPKTIENKTKDWRDYMVRRLTGSKTLPHNFHQVVREKLKSRFEIGMRVEAVDKTRLSSLRVAVVQKIVGRRLFVKYERMEDDEGFWFHEKSPMIHPVGWARMTGHELLSTEEYAKSSLSKALNNKFGPKDASWTLLPPIVVHEEVAAEFETTRFEVGMKLEVIDPLNLSMICVGTVFKVLRSHFLMIAVDGATSPNGSDLMCYHATSPYIFPAGFCKAAGVTLQPPHGYKKTFDWDEYLRETKSRAAPMNLFKRVLPAHEFQPGQWVEAVDLMDPKLVCVAQVTKVVDRLLRIHFEGWDDSYDQWVDCESPDIFPIGWCDMVEYILTPPNTGNGLESPVQLQTPGGAAARKKRDSGGSTGGSRNKKKRRMGRAAADGAIVKGDIRSSSGRSWSRGVVSGEVKKEVIASDDRSNLGTIEDAATSSTIEPATGPADITQTIEATPASVVEHEMKIKEEETPKLPLESWTCEQVVKYLRAQKCPGTAQAVATN